MTERNKTTEGRRTRSSNFSKEEELTLLQEVAKFRDIIECKMSNKVTNKEKESAWQQVLLTYNAKKDLQSRTVEQLMSKYDNLKSKAKKAVAAIKLHAKETGEGSYNHRRLDPVLDAVLQMINLKTTAGVKGNYEGDAAVVSDETVISLPCSVKLEVREELNEPLSEEQHSCSPYEMNPTISNCTMAIQNAVIEKIPERVNTPQSKNEYAEKDVDCSSYTSVRLQKRRSRKPRPTAVNLASFAKQQYYKRKLKVLEEVEKRQRLEFDKKIKRDEEEHAKKMLLLDLEIKLKQQLLKRS